MKTGHRTGYFLTLFCHCRSGASALLLIAGFFWVTFSAPVVFAAEDDSLWQALRSGGYIALLRHASAPGFGDPPEFTLDDCTTQRNLSASGREQAARIGALFRANGIPAARVYSSQWCRCRETAELLGLGAVQELPALNSFFSNFEDRELQTTRLREWLNAQALEQPVVLVTHQVNITALTGVFPSSGELVVVRRTADGEYSLVGTRETE